MPAKKPAPAAKTSLDKVTLTGLTAAELSHAMPDLTPNIPSVLVTYPILAARSILHGDLSDARELMADFAKEGRDLAPYERHALDRACRYVSAEYGCTIALDGNALV